MKLAPTASIFNFININQLNYLQYSLLKIFCQIKPRGIPLGFYLYNLPKLSAPNIEEYTSSGFTSKGML